MVRVAVLEKSKEKREYLTAVIREYDNDIQVIDFYDKYDFLESLDESVTAYDLILLNTTINSEGDGVEIARFIREKNLRITILFVTESTEYYVDAFSVYAGGYAVYPVDIRYLMNCLSIHTRRDIPERRDSIMLKEKGDNYKRIFSRNIRFIESSNREIILHLEDGSEIVSYMKLDRIEQQIHNRVFLRCHQSYLINLYFVEGMNTSRFVIGDTDIPISRRYQKLAKDKYYEYMYERA